MEPSNPYAPPDSTGTTGRPPVFCELVRGWEQLRMIYNGVMILPGLAVLCAWVMETGMHPAMAAVAGVAVGIGANLAFFLGPLAELYLRGMFLGGAPIGRGRLLMFSAGLTISAGVILVAGLIPLVMF